MIQNTNKAVQPKAVLNNRAQQMCRVLGCLMAGVWLMWAPIETCHAQTAAEMDRSAQGNSKQAAARVVQSGELENKVVHVARLSKKRNQTPALKLQAAQLYFWDFFTSTNSPETVSAFINREFEQEGSKEAFLATMRFLVENSQTLSQSTRQHWLKTLDQGITTAQLTQELIPLLTHKKYVPTWIMPTEGLLVPVVLKEGQPPSGVEILGEHGQPVVASAAGEVAYSGTGLRGYGKLVLIKHNAIYITAYAHNSRLLVKKGQLVAQGEKIAEMGNTDTNRVKLYFELRRFGKPVDSLKYLRDETSIVCAPVKTVPPGLSSAQDSSEDENLTWVMPAKGQLVSEFSANGNQKGWEIMGELGQPVFASAAGEVVYSDSGLKGYGKLVLIKHNGTYITAYAHNSVLLVLPSQRVAAGEKIAEMGDTDTDRTKLYFEVRRFGKPVDPAKYIKAK